MSPRVSVVIPTFNRSRLVCEAVETVLAQSFTDTEIVVVDDGSTDDTASQLRRFGTRIVYLPQRNRGVNPARNAGIAATSGEYIAMLDSDDLWEPYKLELEVKLLDRFPSAGCAFSDFSILRDGHLAPRGIRTWHAEEHEWRRLYTSAHAFESLGIGMGATPPRAFDVFEGDVYERSLHEPMVLPSTALIRRSALGQGGFPEEPETCGDWEFFALFTRRCGALYIDLETTRNRSHEDAVRLTRIDQRRRLRRRIALIDRIWRADAAFAAQHGAAIDAIQKRLSIELARLHLFASDRAAARATLARARGYAAVSSLPEPWMDLMTHVPGSGAMLRALRSSGRLLRQFAGRKQ
jgi:glycosyltransferase involved in cell wall biosynthesis